MVYHNIVFNISTSTEDKVWRSLASGIGLRHVRHLEVHTSIQSTAWEWVPDHTADLVVGSLLAALRRNQLLSFKYEGCASYETLLTLQQSDNPCFCVVHNFYKKRHHTIGNTAEAYSSRLT